MVAKCAITGRAKRLWGDELSTCPFEITDDGQSLLRGRYMASAGIVENNGVPIDVPLLNRLRANWESIKLGLVEAVDADFGVYEGGHFRAARFANYLAAHNIPWPRLESGALALDDDTFRLQARAYPVVAPLRELRHTLGQLPSTGARPACRAKAM